MDDLTPGQRRTLRAREERTRRKLDRLAAELRKAGWTVEPPTTKCFQNVTIVTTHPFGVGR